MSEFAANAPAPAQGQKVITKTILAWASWDWGSAAINAVMTTFVFTVYLTSDLFGNADSNSIILGNALAIAGLAIALLAPIMGLRSDVGGRRRFWLGVNTIIVAVLTAACFFVFPEPRFLIFGVTLIALASVFSEFASVNYNAMLPQISTPATVGKVSGFGWGMGYLGGIVALSIVLFTLVTPLFPWAGSSEENALNLRLVAVFSAVWFMGFGLPVLFAVPEIPGTAGGPRLTFLQSYRELFRRVVALARKDRHTVYFLIASAVFRDGLAAVFTFGGVIAAGTFGFPLPKVIIFAIAGNVIAAIGAMIGGWLDDRIGPKNVIIAALIGLMASGMGVFFSPSATGFWIFGLLLCLFVGPAQSSSRAFLARLAPQGEEGELFGLYATTGRAVSFLAPTLFAVAITLAAPHVAQAQRYGILGIIAVLLVGFLLLLPVRSPRLLGHSSKR